MSEHDTDNRQKIAARLKEARKMAGLSQAQAAKLLDVHRPAVSEIEAGNRRVSAEELIKLAGLYDVSVGWLTGETRSLIEIDDPRVQLAARELKRLKPENLDKLLRLLAAMRNDE